MFNYETLVLGNLETNCYLLWDEKSKEAVVIDAADDGVMISEEIERLGLKLKYILATHGHFDHNLGVLDLKLIYNSPFACGQEDFFLLKRQRESAEHFLGIKIKTPNIKTIDVDLNKYSEIKIGEGLIKIVQCPGHTPGGVSFLADDLVFSGDTIFADGLRGQTNYSYASTKDIFESISKILNLGDNKIIMPGHGNQTSVIEAKQYFKNI